MAIISAKDRKKIGEWFEELGHPVRLVVFTQETECEYCRETRELVEELADLSELLTAEVRDLVADAEEAQQYGIDKIPAIAVIGAEDYGVRFYGFPGGYEFSSLIEGIVDVSTAAHGLSEETVEAVARLDRPVHMQVFVTPT